MTKSIIRREWWPGLPPTIQTRIMCSDCIHHHAAMAGWQWDRCKHPQADLGSVVRNSETPTCADIRMSSGQCGSTAKWFINKSTP